MTDLGSVFGAFTNPSLPERLTLDDTALKTAFEVFRRREEEAGRKLTFETFSDQVALTNGCSGGRAPGTAPFPDTRCSR